jgi:putative MFS transporter
MAQVALAQEFMPAKRRGALTGIISAITTGGLLLGAFSGAFLMPAIGWRWTFALGAAPAVIALLAARILPESARWLMVNGREAEARRSVAWALGNPTYDGPLDAPPTREPKGWWQIFGYPKIVITTTLVNIGLMTGYYGITTWAPTLLAQVQAIGPAQASEVMIGFSVLGIASRLAAARLADHIGRRRVGGSCALGAAAFLVLAGLIGNGLLLSAAMFWLALMLAFVLADGSLAVCALYSAELWPSHLRGSGAGFAGLTGSVGKILGPVGLAVAVGSGNIVRPEATVSAMLPAFGFLALFLLVCALSYLSFGIEASGRSLERMDRDHSGATRTGRKATNRRALIQPRRRVRRKHRVPTTGSPAATTPEAGR